MTHRIPATVAHVRQSTPEGEVVFLLQLPDGEPYALVGNAALVWTLATSGTSDVTQAVADATGEAPGSVDGPVQDFLADLVALGFLVNLPD